MGKYDYAQGVVMARVYEKKLLDRAKFERLIDSKDADEAFKVLMETDYAKSVDGVDGPKDYERLLKNETSRLFKQGAEMLQDKKILEILSLRYDYHNLKALIKSKIAKKDLSDIFIYSSDTDPKKIQYQLESGNFNNIRSEFKKALVKAENKYGETSNPQYLDIEIDKVYFEHLRQIADSLDNELFDNYISGLIDFYNISSMLRAIKMGLGPAFLEDILVEGGNISKNRVILLSREDYERIAQLLKSEKIGSALQETVEEFKLTNSLTLLDKAKDKYLSKLNMDSRFVTFGPEPIFAYLVAKENEIAMVRLIMVGKINNISADKLKERLGDYLV